MSDPLSRLSAALAGRYRLERQVGQGGMATVYLARDLRHDREVALKVLHPELGAVIGADRFLSEIKVTARLQHPHILGLIDSGEADGLLFYVMPFVSGESLRDRLRREKQLPISDTVRIASEVASALDYAHRQGVIHRDIKPENVLLHEGQALVADFGIALALTTASGGRMTQTGMSLGTPSYMSPEQAMGEREITARSDIYSLGAMTYEMLTGDPPFNGSNSQAIVAQVLTERPTPPSSVRDTVPPVVEVAVLTALSKLPADRFGTAREFAEALKQEGGVRPGAGAAARRSRLLPFGGAALLLLGAVAGWLVRRPPPAAAPTVVEFSIDGDSTFVLDSDFSSALAISRDGTRIVTLGRTTEGRRLYLRDLGRSAVQAIPGSEGAIDPVLSPDGRSVAFEGPDRTIRVASLEGESPRTLASGIGQIWGGSWGENGRLVVATGTPQGLLLVPAQGGTPERLTTPAEGESHGWPHFLPGGEAVVFTSYLRSGLTYTPRLGVVRLRDRQVRWLGLEGMMAQYVESGSLVYASIDGTILVQPFDIDKLELRGSPKVVVQGVHMALGAVPVFVVSPGGTLVFRPGATSDVGLALADATGRSRILLRGAGLWSPRFSPDGSRIAFARVSGGRAGGRDIWVYSLADGTASRLTHDLGAAVDPAWSPDGRQLVFSANEEGVDPWLVDADGGTPPHRVVRLAGPQYQAIFTPRSAGLLFMQELPTSSDLLHLSFDQANSVDTVAAGPFRESAPALSPDGKWLAYQSDETGEPEVYVRSWPGSGAHFPVSVGGGREPVWSSSGLRIYYRTAADLVEAELDLGSDRRVRNRSPLFPATWIFGRGNRNYDVAPGGKAFVFLESVVTPQLVVRVNALAP